MINLVSGLVVLVASIVLTTGMVEQALPEGTSRDAAEAYLMSIGARTAWHPKERNDYETRDFPWSDEEVGVLTGVVRGVHSKWWFPFFGKDMIIDVGISEDNKVTELQIEEFLGGQWP